MDCIMDTDFSQYKNIFKHSAIYGLGNLSTKVVSFILLPVFTRFLLPSDYGIIELLTITSSIIVVILNFGMNTAIFKSYFNYEEEEKKRLVLSTAFFYSIVVTLTFLAILLSQASSFSSMLFGKTAYTPHIRLMLFSAFFSTVMLVPLAVLRAEERSVLYIGFTVTQVTLMLALNIYFVVVLKMGVLGILWGSVISGGLVYAGGLLYLLRRIRLEFSWYELKVMLAFGSPLIAAALANKVLTSADRYLLKYLADLHEVGLYSLGYKISSVMLVFVVQPFALAWPVVMFKLAKKEGAKKIYGNVLTYYVLVASWIALALSIFSREVIAVMAPPVYRDAYRVVPMLTVAALFSGVFYIVNVGLNLEKKTGYFPFIIGGAAAFNIAANYLLIPKFGMMGASFATALSQILIVAVTFKVSNRFYSVKYDVRRIAKVGATTIALFFAAMAVPASSIPVSVAVHALLLLSYPLILYLIGFYHPEELQAIREYATRFVRRRR